jgi:ABC-type transporter Mla subunit MlaD
MTQTPDRERWTDEKLDRLANNVERQGAQLESFIFESQRILSNSGEKQNRLDAAVETMVDAIARLTSNSAQQWEAIREMQAEVKGLQIENRRILQRVFGED